MKILGDVGKLSRLEMPGDKDIFRSDDYVRKQSEFLSRQGFLPDIDLGSPTIDQMRKTLESQLILNRSIGNDPRFSMVPQRWGEGSVFRLGKVENGIVVSVDIAEKHFDNREFMRDVGKATGQGKHDEGMSSEDFESHQPGRWSRSRERR